MESEADHPNESYRECLRNHAASLGSYATDGCGEFTSDESTAGGLQCAACGCHRNFHRKVFMVGPTSGVVTGSFPRNTNLSVVESYESDRSGRKRIRTKFTTEQKEKMLEFAEKIGWRMQRKEHGDEMQIQRFCRDIGVPRQVFKVWMHNNHKKNTPTSPSSSSLAGVVATASASASATDSAMSLQ
ncbi:zinc-finger homeodomain protein 11-like [Tasmannia lanceolata]|uniref:zinc-finger homeodomain protein 11-like n=1 Tax=Tasmannia lanceolata TaxID=3420 RepID=UPI0040645FD8